MFMFLDPLTDFANCCIFACLGLCVCFVNYLFFSSKCPMLQLASPVISFLLFVHHSAVFPFPQHPSAVNLKGKLETDSAAFSF